MAVAMVDQNVPFAFADTISPLVKACFKDSPTAQGYRSKRTKTTAIINIAVAPHFKTELVNKMKMQPFTLITDGSNDTGTTFFPRLYSSHRLNIIIFRSFSMVVYIF